MAFISSDKIENKPRDLMDVFLDRFLTYLETHPVTQTHKDLAAWIRSGRGISGFICRKDVLRDMEAALEAAEMPNIVIRNKNGECGILIRETDEKKVRQITKDVLREKSRFVKVVTRRELQENLVHKEDQDRTVLSIDGLTQEEAEYLITMLGNIYEGGEISIDHLVNKSWSCCFAARDLAEDKKKREEAKKIFLQMILRFTGPNKQKNIQKERDEIQFRRLLSTDFGTKDGIDLSKTPLWITGSDEKYLRINDIGYEYGYIKLENGRLRIIPQEKYEKLNYDYDKMLMSRCLLMEDIQCTYDMGTAINRIARTPIGGERDIALIQTAKTDNGERLIAGMLDALIMKHTMNEPSMSLQGHWGEKIRTYKEEAAEILNALIAGEIPSGYEPEEFNQINAVMEYSGHTFRDYEKATDLLRDITTMARTAELERISDPVKEAARIQEEKRDKEQEELDRQDMSMSPGD